jgi:hypothetical protein
MPCKQRPQPEPDNPEQFKRFIDMAREVGVDERPDAIDRAFERVVQPKRPLDKPQPPRKG